MRVVLTHVCVDGALDGEGVCVGGCCCHVSLRPERARARTRRDDERIDASGGGLLPVASIPLSLGSG